MNNPGLHSRELSRQLKIPYSTLKYHLGCLEQQGAIMTEREGKYLRHYRAGTMDVNEKKIMSVLRKETSKQIILFLLAHRYASQIQLSRKLGKHPTTIGHALKELVALNVIKPMKITEVNRMRRGDLNGLEKPPESHEQFFRLKNQLFISHIVRFYQENLCTE